MLVFSTPLVNQHPSTFSLVYLPPLPPTCVNKYGGMFLYPGGRFYAHYRLLSIAIVLCGWGGGGVRYEFITHPSGRGRGKRCVMNHNATLPPPPHTKRSTFTVVGTVRGRWGRGRLSLLPSPYPNLTYTAAAKLMHANSQQTVQNTEYRIQNTEYRIQNTEQRILKIEQRIQKLVGIKLPMYLFFYMAVGPNDSKWIFPHQNH